jgi:hypothetical protein
MSRFAFTYEDPDYELEFNDDSTEDELEEGWDDPANYPEMIPA